MKIIRNSSNTARLVYEKCFYLSASKTNGFFSFECDPDGNVNILTLDPASQVNYFDASFNRKVGNTPVLDGGVICYEIWTKAPAIGLCDHCNTEVPLQDRLNQCRNCGAEYDLNGQATMLNYSPEDPAEDMDPTLGLLVLPLMPDLN